MAEIVFYAKPGCLTNRRQWALLQQLGYRVTVRDLLTENWSPVRLYPFLRSRPVREWFNPAAPAVRSGTLDSGRLDAAGALQLLVADPLLIRRPLLETTQGRYAGFEAAQLQARLGIVLPDEQDIVSCARPAMSGGCENGE